MPSITAAQSLTSITCPNCGKSGSLKSQLPPGAKVRCKGCNRSFKPAIKIQLIECWEADNGPCEQQTPPVPPTAPRQIQTASVPPTQSSNPADLINVKAATIPFWHRLFHEAMAIVIPQPPNSRFACSDTVTAWPKPPSSVVGTGRRSSLSAVACTRLGWAPRPCENGSQPWRIASGVSRLQRDRPGLWSSRRRV